MVKYLYIAIFLLLVSCGNNADDKDLMLDKTYYEVSQYCEMWCFVENSSGDYTISLSDASGMEIASKEHGAFKLIGLKPGDYFLSVLDKVKNQTAYARIRILPKALLAFVNFGESSDSFFSNAPSGLFLMGDEQKTCFILPYGNLEGKFYPYPSFKGNYSLEIQNQTVIALNLYLDNEILVRHYDLGKSSNNALSLLMQLNENKKWEIDSLANDCIEFDESDKHTTGFLRTSATSIPYGFYK